MTFDRRGLAVALAGTASLLAVPALAQQTQQRPPAGAAGQSPQNLTGLSPDQLRMLAVEGGTFLLATARMGLEKAQRAEVKRFGQFEANEQQGVMRAMQLAGHQLPEAQLRGEKAQMVQQLQAASGAEFDRLFLQAQNTGHQEALNVHTAIAESNGPAADRIISLLAADRVREHLIDIEMLSNQRA